MEGNDLKHLSTGEPTYWSSDRNNLPDLLDFCVTKGIPQVFAVAESCSDLYSDRSRILITLTAEVLDQVNEPILSNRHINWDDFRRLINERLTLNILLKIEEDIEAVAKFFNDALQWSGWNATPERKRILKAHDCPILIKKRIEDKTKLRRESHRLLTPACRDYYSLQHRNSKNSSITKMTAPKHYCKYSYQENPLIIPFGRRRRN
jgi:hypothetical protein